MMTDTERAEEAFFPIPGTHLSLFYRVWGNPAGVPVVFVHGGPGNDVAHYKTINKQFFQPERYRVIEVDQRGTGKSTPAVREDFANMKDYMDISIDKMSADFDHLREHLGIDKWLVFGGSWGSTLGLDYAERFPDRCLGLIVRGIYLNTLAEFDAIYARRSFEGDERCLKEFDIFLELAQKEAERRGEPPLDGNDSERFIRLYEDMILRGDRDAMWRFYVFESNLADEDPADRIDPLVIDEALFPEAVTVSFFECRLLLRGTFEDPVDLLGAVGKLGKVPVWVVQGIGDGVCPDVYARQLEKRLNDEGISSISRFVDAGHRASSNGIALALQESLEEFCVQHTST
jgi:proline iminopeptidase